MATIKNLLNLMIDMANSILIASGKGGVGKTTLSTNIAVALSEFGRKIALVDVDLPTPNLSLHLNIPKNITTLNDVIKGKASIEQATYSYSQHLKIIPAGIMIESLEGFNPRAFRELMREIATKFEVTLFDCAPGLSGEVINAFYGGEKMIVITNPEEPAVVDCSKTVDIAKELGVDVKGIVLNRTGRFEEELSEHEVSESIFKLPILGKVPEDRHVARAIAARVPVVVKYPYCPAARAITKIAHSLVGKEYQESFTIKEKLKILLGKYEAEGR